MRPSGVVLRGFVRQQTKTSLLFSVPSCSFSAWRDEGLEHKFPQQNRMKSSDASSVFGVVSVSDSDGETIRIYVLFRSAVTQGCAKQNSSEHCTKENSAVPKKVPTMWYCTSERTFGPVRGGCEFRSSRVVAERQLVQGGGFWVFRQSRTGGAFDFM